MSIKNILVESSCQDYVTGVLGTLCRIRKGDFVEPTCDHLKPSRLNNTHISNTLYDSTLQERYDVCVVSEQHFRTFIPVYHRATFIFVFCPQGPGEVARYLPLQPTLHSQASYCIEGVLLSNIFHSIQFPLSSLSLYESAYVRDRPHRFLAKQQELIEHLVNRKGEATSGKKRRVRGTIVEIGSATLPVKHDISIVSPTCCSDPHSTLFWCRTSCHVHAVDTDENCERILNDAFDRGHLKIKGRLSIHAPQDGLEFLTQYDGAKIDFLFLDAWEVKKGSDHAEKHLEAFNIIEGKLADNCLLGINDTDIGSKGKGELLIPHLVTKGWIILYQGRQTVLFRGNREQLFATESS